MIPDIDQLADMLREQVDENGYIDVDVDNDSPISRIAIDMALETLKGLGYHVHFMKLEHMDSVGNGALFKVLAAPDVTQQDVFINRGNIKPIDFSQQ